MTDKAWKAAERAIAKVLGGQRVGCTGEATPDVEHAWLAAEVKTRATFPSWLTLAMVQAGRNAAKDKLPIVVLHQKGWNHDDDLVLMRLADFSTSQCQSATC